MTERERLREEVARERNAARTDYLKARRKAVAAQHEGREEAGEHASEGPDAWAAWAEATAKKQRDSGGI